jgi:nitrite reductase/ring-hydroxylating ferredoxin subunit
MSAQGRNFQECEMAMDMILLCKAADVKEGAVIQVTPPGFEDGIAVYNLGGDYYATDDMCTHALVSLAQGHVEDGMIICPLHGGAFDIRSGAPTEFPCTRPLKTYRIEKRGEELYGAL